MDVVRTMVEHEIGSAVIVDDDRRVHGILTERDLVWKVLAKEKPISKMKLLDVCTLGAIGVNENQGVLRAAELMKAHTIKKIVVVDDNERYVGMLTHTDIVKNLPDIIKNENL